MQGSRSVRECVAETQGGQRVQGCVRCELARDGARGFRFGIGCSGVILMTRDGHRQVRIGQIGVGTVMIVIEGWHGQMHCMQMQININT